MFTSHNENQLRQLINKMWASHNWETSVEMPLPLVEYGQLANMDAYHALLELSKTVGEHDILELKIIKSDV